MFRPEISDAIRAKDASETARLFVIYPEQVTAFTPFAGGTWLHYAAREGALEIVELLISLGIDVNAFDRHGEQTPLTSAASGGHVQIVQCLLDNGAIIQTETSVSNPIFACISGYSGSRGEPRERYAEVAKVLIHHGIDLTACYCQQSMVDMDAAAFAEMWGRGDIAAMVIAALYGRDERLAASAYAEAVEVAVGNSYSRQKFRRWRYPTKNDVFGGATAAPGEFWS